MFTKKQERNTMKQLTVNDHVQILFIKAGLSNRQKVADMLGTWRQLIYACVHGHRRTRWVRQRIFEILRERLPDEVREYSDVWIDENQEAA